MLTILCLTAMDSAEARLENDTESGVLRPETGDVLPAELEDAFEEIAARVEPGVVCVRAFTRDADWHAAEKDRRRSANGEPANGGLATEDHTLIYDGFRPVGVGTGFVVSEDGYIFTTRSTLLHPDTKELCELIDVEIDDSVNERARVVSADPTINLAVLRVITDHPLQPLSLGNSGRVRPGQWAFAFGDPQGPGKTRLVTHIAYEPNRDCYQDELSATYIQTSLPVAEPSYGGPVVNARGEVVGINTYRGDSGAGSVNRTIGSGYSLPINLATAIYTSLVFRESKESPFLGISVLPLDPGLREQNPGLPGTGIYIDNVFVPSPASELGIQVGDVLVRMDEDAILSPLDFQRCLYWHGVNGRTELEIVRNGKSHVMNATVVIRPPEATTR